MCEFNSSPSGALLSPSLSPPLPPLPLPFSSPSQSLSFPPLPSPLPSLTLICVSSLPSLLVLCPIFLSLPPPLLSPSLCLLFLSPPCLPLFLLFFYNLLSPINAVSMCHSIQCNMSNLTGGHTPEENDAPPGLINDHHLSAMGGPPEVLPHLC